MQRCPEKRHPQIREGGGCCLGALSRAGSPSGYHQGTETWLFESNDSTEGWVFALQEANQDLILGIPYGSPYGDC